MVDERILTMQDEVDQFLGGQPIPAMIGGRPDIGHAERTYSTVDPGTGVKLAEIAALDPTDVDRAVLAARRAFDDTDWATMPPNDRAVHLHRLADVVERKKAVLGELEARDTGTLLPAAIESAEINVAGSLRYFADLAVHVRMRNPIATPGHEAWSVKFPWGPCGFVFPWNVPIGLLGVNVSPALAAGNTVVIKPASDGGSLSAIYFAQLAKEAGIPDGVINVVTGAGSIVGNALASHRGLSRMSFTGSYAVGREIGAICGRNLTPVKLELGGKGAAVVFDDVDLDRTVAGLTEAITLRTGQICCTATRWFIQRPIYDAFVSAAINRLRDVKIGYQLDADTEMGPLISDRQREVVLGYVQRGVAEGAELLLANEPTKLSELAGSYVTPALMTGSLGNVAAREEIFGPVAYLAPFDDERRAIEMVNDTDYGLANSVWTQDLGRANRVAEAMVSGNSWINAHNLGPRGVPYAGVKSSGLGSGVGSVETLFDYWRSLSVVRPL